MAVQNELLPGEEKWIKLKISALSIFGVSEQKGDVIGEFKASFFRNKFFCSSFPASIA